MFEDTVPDATHEDDVPPAANKLLGTAAYLLKGYSLGIPANGPPPYANLSLDGMVNTCFGTAYCTDTDILGPPAAVKMNEVY